MVPTASLHPHAPLSSGPILQNPLYNSPSPAVANRMGVSHFMMMSPGHFSSPIVDFGLPLTRMPDEMLAQTSAAVARMRTQHDMNTMLAVNAVSPSPQAPLHHQTIGGNRLAMLRAAMGIPDLEHEPVGGRRLETASIPSTSSPSGRAADRPSMDTLPRDSRGLLFVDSILEADVLCGRGGLSNHHPGNKRFRRVVSEMKRTYRSTETKNNKTSLSRAIVDHVCNYGGRFIKKDAKSGRYHVLTKADARKKTSQALRETKELKWTI
jgi:hypothetical protein